MCIKSCDSGKVFVWARPVDGSERAQFDSVWGFSLPGAVPVVTPLIPRSPTAP